MTSPALTFQGYRRPDGRVGVRNHVLVLAPTGLTARAAARIANLVYGTVCVVSGYGRGQIGADARLQFDTLAGLAANPNIAATLVVAAGADISQSYVDMLQSTGKRVAGLALPEVREDAIALVDAGVRIAAGMVRDASRLRRETFSLADLCIAMECGHSDTTSGLAANPLVGRVSERVVAAGGKAIFSETVEWTGAEHVLARRAADIGLAARIQRAVVDRERLVRESGGNIRDQNPGPQNKAGGLTTIEEKALGAIAKGGDQPISGLLKAAEAPPRAGLYLMDTPYFSPESVTAMVAAGAQMVLFTTGAGNSYSSLVAPTVKVSANRSTFERLPEQIDIDASAILRGESTLDDMADEVLTSLVGIASGTLTFGEILGEGNEVVSRLGPSI